MENSKTIFNSVTFCKDAYEVAEGVDALVIATEWNEFRALNLDRVKKLVRQRSSSTFATSTISTRMQSRGFAYICVGRAEDVRVREHV